MARSLRSLLWRGIAYFVVLQTHLTIAILFWPRFAKAAPALRALIPPSPARDDFDKLLQGGVFGYVTGQHLFKFSNLVGTLAAVMFAVGAVAGEAHRGTLEIWLARPLSRRRILTERWLCGAAALVIPLFASSLTVPWLLEAVDQHTELTPLLLATAHHALFLTAFYAVAFFLSTVGRAPMPIALAILFVTLLELAVYLVESATYWSIFRLADMDRLLWIHEHRALDWRLAVPLTAVVIASYVASLIAFARRTP